jgi:UDP-N-acetylmuramoyl-L-alanyl-D-glutamate--2,6-diaminopimelate ligase
LTDSQVKSISFGKLVKESAPLELHGDTDVPVNGVFYDSRKMEPGGVFVAIEGFRADGRVFIADALKRGAAAFIVGRGTDVAGLPAAAVVDDVRLALAEAAAALYSDPAQSLTNVAVTGTNGKTTTCSLLNDILSHSGQKTVLFTTVKVVVNGEEVETKLTTEEAPTIQRYLAEAVEKGAATAIIEASSIGIELRRIAAIPFQLAVFTNLSLDHTDFHGDMEGYYQSKRELFYGLNANAVALINIGDEYGKRLFEDLQGRGLTLVAYGRDCDDCDFSVSGIANTESGIEFDIKHSTGENRISLPMKGRFNALNATAAFAAAISLGVGPEVAAPGLAGAQPVAGRFETVVVNDRIETVIDYAHSPDSIRRVLGELRRGRDIYLIAVFGCTGDRDREKRPEMGGIAAEAADYVIVTSDDLYSEEAGQIAAEVESGIKTAGGEPGLDYEIENDRGAAIRKALKKAPEDEKTVIALLGKGHEKYQIVGDERRPFNDRDQVIKAARELKL